ncbi:hypothetical protein DV738_g4274, partial [Chaetothyriales sp. CBS 135597]
MECPLPPPALTPVLGLRHLPGLHKAAHVAPDTFSPVDENGSFCFDRVLKRGKVQRRIKHKGVWKHSWRPAYLVLRPNLLSVYKNADETDLRASIALSDITAVARVKKAHVEHVFAVFSPAKNHHFQAASERDAADWVHQIRLEARPDDLDSLEPPDRTLSGVLSALSLGFETTDLSADDDSPEAAQQQPVKARPAKQLTTASKPIPVPGSALQDSYGVTEHNTTSVSDFSDFQSGSSVPKNTTVNASNAFVSPLSPIASSEHQIHHSPRRLSAHNDLWHDPERVIRQGWLQILRSKTGGIKAWKSLWVVLRPKNVCLYKNEQEYSAVRVLPMSTIIDAAEIDAQSRHKQFCFQIIAEDKTYRLCAPNEDALAKWLGSLKSVLSRRHPPAIVSIDLDNDERGDKLPDRPMSSILVDYTRRSSLRP